MAAYSLLESFLIREVLRPGDTILIAPYIYFEISEQLETIPWIKIIRSDSYKVEDLVLLIVSERPKVVFLETLTNNGDLRLIDVAALLSHFEDSVTSPYFVIDGTMTSCLSNFLAKLDNRDKIFYIESCSKYLQCGLELTLAGVLICDVQFKSKLHILRRNAGLILTEQNAYMFPIYNRTMMQDRLGRIAYNASYVAKKLSQIDEVTAFCEIIHPSLETHPDHMLASRLHILGACIVVRLKSDGVMLDNQNKFTNCLISTAKRYNFPLVMGESFGFSFPRITIAFTGNASSFIRLYVGDMWQMNDKLVQVVYETVSKLMSCSDQIRVQIVTQNKFTDLDVQMIISEIKRMNKHGDAFGLIISMMYRYGLNMHMIMSLTWSQIDFDNNILKVHGEKEARIFPLAISDVKILLKLQQKNTETRRVFDLKNSGITQHSLSRALKKAVKNTGINKIVSLKMLRLQKSKYLTVGQKYLY